MARAKLCCLLLRVAASAGAILCSGTGVYGQGQLITFDDLTTTNDLQVFNGSNYYYSEVPTNYNGLTWTNFGVTAGAIDTNSGYQAAVVSSKNVVFNRNGNPASISNGTPFSVMSAYFTAAWNDNLQLEAQGYAGGTLLYDRSYTLSATAPTLISFNYAGVDQVLFRAFGGTPHSGYSYSDPPYAGGTWFAMDNLTVTTNPGPRLTVTRSRTELILTWPTNATGFTVQSATNLVSQAAWTTVSPGPTVVNGQNTVTNPISRTQQFFRLSQ
ncbi:MAG TPA: hypothetical protein VNZ64_21990 [Candidatus Acidoferrum sp.]|jgi:hypothetical protein|nr:hypothetical protein [Candidatus Acidoferrum sp.]